MDQIPKSNEYEQLISDLIDVGVQYGLAVITAIAVLIAGLIISRWLSRMLRRRLENIEGFDQTLPPILAQIVRYAILIMTFVVVLAEFGIQTTSIIALLGAAGIAVGLALQGTLQNVSAGMMLLLLRPFHRGDYIDTGAGSGTVDEIGLFMTRMQTPQGIFVAAPNAKIWADTITNYSASPRRRLDLLVGISYDSDIDRATQVLLALARHDKRILGDPAPVVVVKALGESSVDLELRAWVGLSDFWDVNFQMNRAVKYSFDKAGIDIPYPHRQLVFKQMPGSDGAQS